MCASPTVIIHYSHDSPEHKKRVLKFANRLRKEGIDVFLDQYEKSPPQGWPRWMEEHINNDNFVLMVCTPQYFEEVMDMTNRNKGKGVKWEVNLIYQQIYNLGTQNSKFIPVLFNDSSSSSIPTPIQGATRYYIETEEGYKDLYRHLTNQPGIIKPTLGEIKHLPPEEIDSYKTSTSRSRNTSDTTIERKQSSFQVETVECAFCQGTGEDNLPFVLNRICPVCDGNGEKEIKLSENEKLVECAFCQGAGKDNHPYVLNRICPVCKGLGVNIIQKSAKKCGKCDGTGEDNTPFALSSICSICKGTGYK